MTGISVTLVGAVSMHGVRLSTIVRRGFDRDAAVHIGMHAAEVAQPLFFARPVCSLKSAWPAF